MRISLKPVASISDVEQVKVWAADPEQAEFFRRYPPVSVWPADVLAWFSQSSIIQNEEGAALGLFSFSNVDNQNRQIEFGLLLDKDACAPLSRRAVAVEVLAIELDYAFNYLGFEKVYSKTLAHRDTIFAGYEQYGFTKEATLRHNIRIGNKYYDEVVYGLLASEWASVQQRKVSHGN